MEKLDPDSPNYGDSTVIIQLLKDNLNVSIPEVSSPWLLYVSFSSGQPMAKKRKTLMMTDTCKEKIFKLDIIIII